MARLAGPSSVQGFRFGFLGCTCNLTRLTSKPLHMLSLRYFARVVHLKASEIRDDVSYVETVHDADLKER